MQISNYHPSSPHFLSHPLFSSGGMDPSEAKQQRKRLLLMAKLALEVNRYDHMVRFMLEIVKATSPEADLSPKERSLLGAAIKNYLIHPFQQWRTLMISSAKAWSGEIGTAVTASYLLKVKKEISSACAEAVQLIDRQLLPSAATNDSKVFYLTMKAELSWYWAEIKGNEEGSGDAEASEKAYTAAWEIARSMESVNPHRLALELSLAEWYIEFLDRPESASMVAKQALKSAFLGPEEGTAAPILSFQGCLQLVAKLTRLQLKLKHQYLCHAAEATNARSAASPEAGEATNLSSMPSTSQVPHLLPTAIDSASSSVTATDTAVDVKGKAAAVCPTSFVHPAVSAAADSNSAGASVAASNDNSAASVRM